MTLSSTRTLSPTELEHGLTYVVKDGVTSQAMITLTTGVFLSAFALALGAPNIIIGLLAAIPPLAQLIQIPSIYLIERWRDRKKITLASATTSRTILLLIALVPFVATGKLALYLLLGGLVLNSVAGAVGNCSWNSWMRDLIPEKKLGDFFSRRLGWAMGVSVIISILAGSAIDRWKLWTSLPAVFVYALIFGSAFACGALGLFFISRIPEPPLESEPTRFSELLVRPLQDSNFRNLLIFLGVWNFAVNLAVPFFAVYMIGFMKLPMLQVTMFTIISQIMNVWSFHIWGKFSDVFSNRSVLAVSCPLALIAIVAWTFVLFPGRHMLTLPLLLLIHICFGVAMAGVLLATGNIALKLAPKGQATAYLATSSIVNSLATGIAPIIGGACADLFRKVQLSWSITLKVPQHIFTVRTLDLQYWDFFFVFAFLIGLYALHRLALVKEEGTVHERIVWKEFMSETGRELRLFTAGSFNMLAVLPFTMMRRSWPRQALSKLSGLWGKRGPQQGTL